MLAISFSSKMSWGSYIAFIAKTGPKKIKTLIYYLKFLSDEVVLAL